MATKKSKVRDEVRKPKKLSKLGEYLENWTPLWNLNLDKQTMRLVLK